MLLDRGVEVAVPMAVPKHHPGAHKIVGFEQWNQSYRPAHFAIMASCSGSVEVLRLLPFEDVETMSCADFICFSKKRKNLVRSSTIGAAAYHGQS